ncbi:SpoIIE family protein phosphatase [Streptomyces chitinivorans]|uniref:SpoIIE family protein phosphatase n=1 Tax=Streptomyces chitinivorans TaxID=1257027 RepID=A0ABW7HZK6_9ACTN|nr:SpoIIE family protein phosphatase [Streptomyces chitinivorans]MDH2412071.1 SpoIIE family protein phosphatase [Streptomyces chitinivorans]
MSPTTDRHDAGADPARGGPVVFVLDGDGIVLRCTDGVLDLIGRSADQVRGRPMAEFATAPGPWDRAAGNPGSEPVELRTALRHRDGTPVEVDAEVLPLPAGGEARLLMCAAPSAAGGRRWTEDQSLIRALFGQSRIGLVIHDTELRTTRANLGSEFFGIPLPAKPWQHTPGRDLRSILVPEDAAAIEEQWRRVLRTGEAVIDWEHSARRLKAPDQERVLSSSAFRLEDSHGRAIGVAAVFTDITEQYTARRRLALLHAAAARLGQTLDITRNSEELTRILVPDFADLACVDLVEKVIQGDDPGAFSAGTPLRRIAVAPADGSWPAEMYQRGDSIHARDLESDALRDGQAVLVPDLADLGKRLAPDPARQRLLFPEAAASALIVPLRARGRVLGVLGLWRGRDRLPFAVNDVPLAEEVASRAALSVENSRRYTSELRTVETLQRSLLPPAGVEFTAAETAGTYVPAGTAAGIGGSWYDVIPLSSTRVAFVIGDVAGHGLGATATMGRLRTAVQTLADLDLPPEELLTHLDDLATRLAYTEPQPDGSAGGVVGASCLYCVYDPVTGRCAMASAGHPPPILTSAEGRTRHVDIKPGPALGVGGMPFEPVELHLGPGSVLAFYTNQLVAHDETSSEGLTRRLRESLHAAVKAGGSPADIGRAAVDRVLTEPAADDIALLVARVRALPEGATVAWRFTADPTVVGQARELVTAQLTAWGLEEMAFTTELIVSELVTNAIRYAGSPIGLRLIRDKTLICEVSDPSQTQPHLRRARLTDEGGRGLFLIAQLAHRWGSRYTPSGKTIWTEQALGAVPEIPLDVF